MSTSVGRREDLSLKSRLEASFTFGDVVIQSDFDVQDKRIVITFEPLSTKPSMNADKHLAVGFGLRRLSKYRKTSSTSAPHGRGAGLLHDYYR